MVNRRDILKGGIGVLAALACGAPGVASAADNKKRAMVLAKVLSYERRLSSSHGGSVGIVALYASGNGESKGAADAWVSAFTRLKGLKVHGVGIKAKAMAFGGSVGGSLKADGIDIVIACAGVAAKDVAALAKSHKVLSVADLEAGVRDGLALGVFLKGGKPKLFVNMKASKSQGAKFGSKLLKLAKVL